MAAKTRNAEIVQGALQAVFSEHRLDEIDQFFSPEFVQHSPYASPGGRDELRQWWARIVEAIPDVTTTVDLTVSDDDRVAVFRSVQGTIQRDLGAFGIKGSGQRVAFRVADVFAVREGKITAHWEVADTGPFLQRAPRTHGGVPAAQDAAERRARLKRAAATGQTAPYCALMNSR